MAMMLDTDQVFKNIEDGHVRHRNEIEELKSNNKRLRTSIVNFEGRLDRLEQIANRVPGLLSTVDRLEEELAIQQGLMDSVKSCRCGEERGTQVGLQGFQV